MRFIISYLILLLALLACQDQKVQKIISYKIEFDGGKEEFFDKYDLWLNIQDSNEVKSLSELIDQNEKKIRCINYRPVMWEIDVFANYQDTKSKHILTLGMSTYMKESLQIDNVGCFENEPLKAKLKKLMLVDRIQKFSGKMRQGEFEIIQQIKE